MHFHHACVCLALILGGVKVLGSVKIDEGTSISNTEKKGRFLQSSLRQKYNYLSQKVHLRLHDELENQLTEDLQAYLDSGKVSELLQDTSKIFLKVPDAGRKFSEPVQRAMTCLTCKITFDLFKLSRRVGTELSSLEILAMKICNLWTLFKMPKVCKGLIKHNANILLYILDRKPDLSSKHMCGVILQDRGCESDEHVKWSVKIPNQIDVRSKYPVGGSSKAPMKVLQITDIHFDPKYKVGANANCKNPLCCQDDDEEIQSETDKAGYWTDYRKCDAPLHLVADSLSQIKSYHNNLDFVYFTGDIISHRVWDTSVEGNIKDLKLIYRLLRDTFGEKSVFPLIGNHEPHPLNVFAPKYIQEPEFSTQWLYDIVADEWSTWLPKDTRETILKGGFYTTLVRPGLRVIALNSNVGYIYNWWLLLDPTDPYGQLQWLSDTLFEAEKNEEKVQILTHIIPSDITCYITWGAEFRRILERFHNTITGIFYGHTHYDEFVVYYNKTDTAVALNVAYNGGSITPYDNLNPNYRIYYVDQTEYNVQDYEQWIFNLTLANQSPFESPRWFHLYSFKDHFEVDDMHPETIGRLVEKIAQYKHLSERYNRVKHKFAKSEAEQNCARKCQVDNLCDIVRNEFADSRKCHSLTEMYDNNN